MVREFPFLIGLVKLYNPSGAAPVLGVVERDIRRPFDLNSTIMPVPDDVTLSFDRTKLLSTLQHSLNSLKIMGFYCLPAVRLGNTLWIVFIIREQVPYTV